MQKFASKELSQRVEIAAEALNESKAIDINVISFENKGMMAEAIIVVNGTSNVHMQAIASKVSDNLKQNKIEHIVEGPTSDVWVLVDCGDIVIHIFSEESRSFYALERLWSDTVQSA